MSRYHRLKQHDGLGFGILVIDAHDVTKATVLHANMTEKTANARLEVLRFDEQFPLPGGAA